MILKLEKKIKKNILQISDSESILALYHKKGIDVFKTLRGMYAFVIYDKKSRRSYNW